MNNTNDISGLRRDVDNLSNSNTDEITKLKANDEKLDTKINKVSDDLKDAIKNGKYTFKSENSTVKIQCC